MCRVIPVLGMLLALGVLPPLQAAENPVSTPESIKASYSSQPVYRMLNAIIEAEHRTTVSAQTSGRIVEINFDVDDFVEKNAVLIRLHDVEQKARLRNAESRMKEAQANLEQAAKEYRRISDVYKRKLVSKAAFDKAVSAHKAAIARMNASKAAVAEAREQWEYTQVRAPYSGIVVKRHVQLGESARSGQQLMTGLSLDHLRATVNLPQDLVGQARAKAAMFAQMSNGKKVDIATDAITIFPFADAQSHTFSMRLSLPPGLAGLYPGMIIKVGIETGKEKQMWIPAKALVHRSEVTAVYVMQEGGLVSLRQVRAGQQQGDQVQILSGLREDDKVMLDTHQAVLQLKKQSAR